MSLRYGSVCLLLFSGILGCNNASHKVEGTVTMDGKPVEGATVTFFPASEGGQAASSMTDASGKFKLLNPSNDKGIPNGTYKATVVRGSEGIAQTSGDHTKDMLEFHNKTKEAKSKDEANIKSMLPVKYSKADTTPLTITIPASGSIELKLEK